jgi:hypothetical protein
MVTADDIRRAAAASSEEWVRKVIEEAGREIERLLRSEVILTIEASRVLQLADAMEKAFAYHVEEQPDRPAYCPFRARGHKDKCNQCVAIDRYRAVRNAALAPDAEEG